MRDLITHKITRITAHTSVQCDDLAQLLLNEPMAVNKLRKENTSDSKFVRAVLTDWLSRNDDDPMDLVPLVHGSLWLSAWRVLVWKMSWSNM